MQVPALPSPPFHHLHCSNLALFRPPDTMSLPPTNRYTGSLLC